MTPNGKHQIIGPDQSQIFDAGVNFLSLRHQCENPYWIHGEIFAAVGEPLAGSVSDALLLMLPPFHWCCWFIHILWLCNVSQVSHVSRLFVTGGGAVGE